MFDIGGAELLFLVVLALIVFGPRRLPEMGRQVGTYANKLRRSWKDLQTSIEREVSLEEIKSAQNEIRALKAELKREVRSVVDPIPRSTPEPSKPAGPGPSGGEA